jgi:hypothetical protein
MFLSLRYDVLPDFSVVVRWFSYLSSLYQEIVTTDSKSLRVFAVESVQLNGTLVFVALFPIWIKDRMMRRCSVQMCAGAAPTAAGAVAAAAVETVANAVPSLKVHIGPARSEAVDISEPMMIEQPTITITTPDQHYSLRRSLYSTFRRLPGKSGGGRPGQCVRGIFAYNRRLNSHAIANVCGPLCCCSAVVSPMWSMTDSVRCDSTPLMQDSELQTVMNVAAAARVMCMGVPCFGAPHKSRSQCQPLHDVAPSLSTFLSKWTRLSSTSSSHDHHIRIDSALAQISPLCADINPALVADTSNWLAQLIFTAEESESVYYFIVRLQDVALHSAEETNRLLTVTSLKVLLAVSSIRHSTSDRHHSHHSHPHSDLPSHQRQPQHQAADTPSVKVLPEVYETVLKTIVDAHLRESSNSSNHGVPSLLAPIGLIDIAAAFALRSASPNACIRFICDVLHKFPINQDRELTIDLVYDLIASASAEVLDSIAAVPQPGTMAQENLPTADSMAELLLLLTVDVLSATSRNGTQRAYLHGRRRIVELIQRYCEELLKVLPHAAVSPSDFDTATGSINARNTSASPLSRLLSRIVEWQRATPLWMNQELSGVLTQVLDGIVQAAARSGGSTSVLQLLRSVGLTNVLHMERMFFVAVPILRGLQSAEDLVGDFIEHAVSDAALMYAGTQANMLLSADSAAALDAFLRAVEKKRVTLQQTPECKPASDSDVISSILEDFALLGKHVYSSQQVQVRSDDARYRLHCISGMEAAVDPDAALLGGPVEFARYLLSTVKQVWADIKSIRPNDDDGDDNDSSHSINHADASVPPVTPITVSPSVVRDFTLLLERVVVLSMSVLRHQVPLVSPALSKIIDSSLQLPNLHDEYRRKLFLMVNVDSTRHNDVDPKDGTALQGTPEALLKLTAALPLQFLPWSSTQITKEVLATSHGHGPRYLHLLRTAVDLQLPPSTARSRIAGVLEVYKLVRSQRDKLPPLEYTRLLLRCLMSLPLSYIFSSWTFFLWWTFVGSLVALHVTGWSWEAMYVIKSRRLEFTKPLTGGAGLTERTAVAPTDSLTVVEYMMTNANTLVAHPIANTVLLVVHDVDQHAAPPLQFRVAEAACRSLNPTTTTPFVLRYPPAVGGGTAEYLVVDDILRDCAQRIRREANTTWNPFQRLIFNLFPLFRPSAEESLIGLTKRRAAAKGVPCTFILALPDHVYVSEASLQRLRDVFARQYVSNLVVVVNHKNPSITAISKRLEVVSSRGDAESVLEAAAVCQGEGEEERWNIAAVSDSLGVAVFAAPDGYRVTVSGTGSELDDQVETVFVSPMWKCGVFTSLVRPRPSVIAVPPPPNTHQQVMGVVRDAQQSIPSLGKCRRVSAQALEGLIYFYYQQLFPVLRKQYSDAAQAIAETQLWKRVHSLHFFNTERKSGDAKI